MHTLAWAFRAFLGNVLYDTAKAATARLAYGTAQQLRDHRVAVVAVAPGHLGVSETPEYLGRGVTTLAADPHILAKTGELLTVGQLAREYGFTDLDGTSPNPGAYQERAQKKAERNEQGSSMIAARARPQSLARGALAGLLATVAMDVGARTVVAPALGIAPLGPEGLGRWVGHMRHGQFTHANIAAAPSAPNETAIGIASHYDATAATGSPPSALGVRRSSAQRHSFPAERAVRVWHPHGGRATASPFRPATKHGFQVLSESRGRGTNLAANALAHSSDTHQLLRHAASRARFLFSCLNLQEQPAGKGQPITSPDVRTARARASAPVAKRMVACESVADPAPSEIAPIRDPRCCGWS